MSRTTPQRKQCLCCGQRRLKKFFHKDRRRKDGVAVYCKDCVSEKQKRRYAANRKKCVEYARQRRANPEIRERERQRKSVYNRQHRERIAADMARRREENPEKYREIARRSQAKNAAKNTPKRRAYYQKNRERILARDRAHRAKPDVCERYRQKAQERWQEQWANPVCRQRMREKQYERSRRRQARKNGAPVIEIVGRREIYVAGGGVCWLCNQPVKYEQMHVDHVVPLSKGGSHVFENLRPAHARCNRQKGSKLPDDFFLWRSAV